MLEALLLVGVAIILIPPLLERFHIDIRAGEIITGVIFVTLFPEIGHEQWLQQVADIGLLVLMFHIGLDIDTQRLQDTFYESIQYGLLSFFVPFMAVFAAVFVVLGDWILALLFGIGLSATALAVVIPLMKRQGIDSPLVKNASMISEMIGIGLLVAFVHGQQMEASRLVTQAFAIFGFISFTIFVVPRMVEKLQVLDSRKFIRFETKLVIFIVLALSLISEQLGAHAATGAFLAGLFFSESTHRGMELEERITPIKELLVPIFFFHIGTLLTPGALMPMHWVAAIGLAVLVYVTRFAAFYLAATGVGPYTGTISFDPRNINLFTPCITVTSAGAGIAATLGILDNILFSTFILAGLLLTIVGPALATFLTEHLPRQNAM